MASSEADGKFYAHPTLFPKDPKKYTQSKDDWMELDAYEAFKEADKRGELFEFETEAEARKFAEGGWKPEAEFVQKIDGIARQAKLREAESIIGKYKNPGGSYAREAMGIKQTAKAEFTEKTLPFFQDLKRKDELGAKEFELIQESQELDLWPEREVDPKEVFGYAVNAQKMKVRDGLEVVDWAERKFSKDLDKMVAEADLTSLTQRTVEGVSVADAKAIQKQAAVMAEQMGGGKHTREMLYEKMIVAADRVALETSINKALEKDPQYKALVDGVRSSGIEYEQSVEQAQKAHADYEQRTRSIVSKGLARQEVQYEFYQVALKSSQEEIQEAFDSEQITEEEANKRIKEQNEALYNAFLQEQDKITKATQELADAEYNAFRLQHEVRVEQTYKDYADSVSPEKQQELRDIIEATEDKISGAVEDALSALDRVSPEATFLRRYAGSLGRSLAATSTYLGWEGGRVMGDELARVFKTAENPMEDWKDLLDMDKMIKSGADLAGSMTSSILVGTGTSLVTGGLGTIPAMAAVGIATWGAETADMAGQMYRDKLALTGSISLAKNAASEVVKGQVEDMYLYSLGGAPFVPKFLGKIKNVPGRITTGAALELGEEFFQEWQQGAREESIRNFGNRNRYGEFKTADSAKQTFLHIALVAFSGAGAQSIHVVKDLIKGEQRKDFADAAVREFKLADAVADGAEQFVQGIAFKMGAPYAQAVVDSMIAQGQIRSEQAQGLRDVIDNSGAMAEAAKAKGLKGSQAMAWMKLSRAVESAQTPEMKEQAGQTLKSFEEAPELFPYAMARTGFNQMMVLTEQEATNYLSVPENARDVQDGYIGFTGFNMDVKETIKEAAPKAATRIARKQKARATENKAEAAVIDVSTSQKFTASEKTLERAAKAVAKDSAPQAIRAIKAVSKALSKSKTKIKVHTREDSYLEAIGDRADREAAMGTPGVFLDDTGTIHLNLQEIGTNTAYHEGVHGIIKDLAIQNKPVVSEMRKFLESALPAEAAQELRDFVEKSYDDTVADEEFVAEAVARIIDDQNEAFSGYKIDGGIKAFVDKVVEAVKKLLGVSQEVNLTADMDAEALVRGMISGLKGKEIKTPKAKSKPKPKKKKSVGKDSKDSSTPGKILFQISGEKGWMNLAGTRNLVTEMQQLNSAKKMDLLGKDPSIIGLATGWMREASGQWVREGNTYVESADLSVFLNGPLAQVLLSGGYISLPDLYIDGMGNDLFSMYPALAGAVVEIYAEPNPGSYGSYNPLAMEIGVSSQAAFGLQGIPANLKVARSLLNESLFLSVLTHELQHAIQAEEGLPTGSNPRIAKDQIALGGRLLSKLGRNKDFMLLLAALEGLVKKTTDQDQRTQKIGALLAGIPREFQNGLAQINLIADVTGSTLSTPQELFLAYTRNAGEVLADAAAIRQQMPPQMRSLVDLFSTESEVQPRDAQSLFEDLDKQLKDLDYAYQKGLNYPKLPSKQVRLIYGQYVEPKTAIERTKAFLARFQKLPAADIAEAELYVDDLMKNHIVNGAPLALTDAKDLSFFVSKAMAAGYPIASHKAAVITGALADAGIGKADVKAVQAYRDSYSRGRYDGSHSLYSPKFQATLFHGSPYLFDRFDLNQIGTGEGVQAFGWGLYFTDKESIARTYADKTSLRSMRDKFLDQLPEDADFEEVMGMIGTGAFTKGQEEVLKALEENDWLGFDYPARAISAAYGKGLANYDPTDSLVQAISKSKAIYKVVVNKGKVPATSDRYHVLGKKIVPRSKNMSRAEFREGIASGEIKPLMEFETSEQARAWLDEQDKKADYMWLSWDQKPPVDQVAKVVAAAAERGVEMTEKQYVTGEQLYNDLVSALGSAKEASTFLLKAGMDGVRYPVNATMGTTSDITGAFNYVIFDDKSIEIEDVIRFQKQDQALEYQGMFDPKRTELISINDILFPEKGMAGYFTYYKGQIANIEMMAPDQYLAEVRRGFGTKKNENIVSEKKAAIKEAMASGAKIHMPYIRYNTDGGMYGQEGRNRATVAKEVGEELIPVAVVRDLDISHKKQTALFEIEGAIEAGAQTQDEVFDFIRNKTDLHRDKRHFMEQFMDIPGMIEVATARFQKALPEELEIEDGFYSNLERSVLEFKGDRASAKKWMDMLGKKDEAVFTGVRDWLAAKAPNEQVLKQDIQQWLKDNRTQVEIKVLESNTVPKVLPKPLPESYRYEFDASKNQHNFYDEKDQLAGFGATKEEARSVAEARLNLMESLQAEESKQQAYDDDVYNAFNEELSRRGSDGKGQELLDAWYYDDYGSDSRFHKWAELLRFLEDENIDVDYVLEEINEVKDDETVFNRSELKLPGESSNYREFLIIFLPKTGYHIKKRDVNSPGAKKHPYGIYDANGMLHNAAQTEQEAKELLSGYQKTGVRLFESDHFPGIPNILAHIRTNNRTDSNGKSILFVEEIQSDWAQDARKFGVRGDKKPLVDINGDVIVQDTSGWGREVPTAPYIQNTSAWVKLALKMALKDAVAQGVDYVAWTTGEQQADRYDLSKQVNRVDWVNQTATGNAIVTIVPNGQSDIKVIVDRASGKILEELAAPSGFAGQFKDKALDEAVGKELAEIIINEKFGRREGDGLKVGGKGMIDFYNKIVPGVAQALVREMAGQEITSISLSDATPDVSAFQWDGVKDISNVPGSALIQKGDWIIMDGGQEAYSLPEENYVSEKAAVRGYIEISEKGSSMIAYPQQAIEITPEIKLAVEAGMAKFQRTAPQQPLSNQLEDIAEQMGMGMSLGMTKDEVIEALERDLQINPAVVQKIADRAEWLMANSGGNFSPYRSQAMQTWLWFRHGIQDDKIFLKKVQQAIERQAGNFLPPTLNPYQRMELERSRIDTKARDMMFLVYGNPVGKYIGRKNESTTFKGRLERMKTKQGESLSLDDFFSFLYLQHVPERNDRAEAIRKGDPDFQSNGATQAAGITTAEAQQAMQEFTNRLKLEQLKKLEAMATEFREVVIKDRVRALGEAGVLTEESVANLLAGTHNSGVNWNFYVPIKKREELIDKKRQIGKPGKAKGGSGVMKFSGLSDHKMYELSESGNQAVADYMTSLALIERNHTNRALYDLVQSSPDPRLWSIEKTKKVPTFDDQGNLIEVKDYTDETAKRYGVPVYVDGKVHFVVFRDQDVFKSMQRLDLGGFQKFVMGTVGVLTGLMRNLITTLNLGFAGPNFFRDAQEGLANSTNDAVRLNVKGIRKRYFKNLIPATAVLFKDLFFGVNGTGKMSRLWMEAEDSGMKMSWANYADMSSVIEDLRKTAKQEKGFTDSLPIAPIKALLQAVSAFNDVFENANRLAFYAATREGLTEQGMSADLAAQEAAAVGKNISLNFEKKGSWGSLINAFYLFFNAGIQGAAKTLQLTKTGRGRSVLASMVVAGYVNSAIQHALYAMMLGDDEEGENPLLRLTDSEKRLNWVFMNPMFLASGGDRAYINPLLIPKPYSLITPFLNVGESAYGLVNDQTTGFDAGVKLVEDFGMILDPVTGGAGIKPYPTLGEENLGGLAQALAPDAVVRPLVQIGINQTWNGSKIYPDYNRDAMPKNRYYPSVSPMYINLSQKMFESPLRLNISPEVLEFLAQEYNTGIIRETVNTTEQFANKVRGNEVDRNKLIVVRRFFPDLQADSQTWRNRQIVESFVDRSKFAPGISEGQKEQLRMALSDMVMKEEIDRRRLLEIVKILGGRHDVRASELFNEKAMEKMGVDPETIDKSHDEMVQFQREKERIMGYAGSAHIVLEIMKADAKSKKELGAPQVKRLRGALTDAVLSYDIEYKNLAQVFEHFDYLEAQDLLDGSEFGVNFEGLNKDEALKQILEWYEKRDQ